MSRTHRRPSRRDQTAFTRNTARYVNKRFNVSNPFERVLILLVIAVVVGCHGRRGVAEDQPRGGGADRRVRGLGPSGGRAGGRRSPWMMRRARMAMTATCSDIRETDDDGDGCDVRDEVLARDLEDVTFTTPGGCQVQSGVLHDLYTGKTIDFVRGPQTSSAVQIEHVGGVGERLAVGCSRLGHRQTVQVRQRHVQPAGRRRRGEQREGIGVRRLLAADQRRLPLRVMWPDRSGSRTNTT